MPRSEIYIGSLAYSKELLLIELELLNKLLNKQLRDEDNE
jgi:hypothetical protein